ncbi:MAG TPA: alpha/beta hydrolase-fold protein [Verrucomicrobiaceae bacterium]|jgi:S-formylglutathione hydrolase
MKARIPQEEARSLPDFTSRVIPVLCLALMAAAVMAGESRILDLEMDSELVPGPVRYSVLLPPDYDSIKEPMPLLFDLHGGGGSRENLKAQRGIFEDVWKDGSVPPMVVVMPSVTERGFYMDFRDGSEKWESFLTGPFLAKLRSDYKVRADAKATMLTGASMGGMGSLRIAFKHPAMFGAVAGMEPGIEPVLHWKDIRLKHRFWRGDQLMYRAFGNPVDEVFWEENNPAAIVVANAAKLRDSGLQIYLEAGDEDLFWLYEGAEFLHQTLWDKKVKHEYHLVRGADHVGRSLIPRTKEALRFLARTLQPPARDPIVERSRAKIDPLKNRVREKDHYNEP